MGKLLEQEWERFREELWVEGVSLWPEAREWPLIWESTGGGEALAGRRKAGEKRKKAASRREMAAEIGSRTGKTARLGRMEPAGMERLFLARQGDGGASPGAQRIGEAGELGDVLRGKDGAVEPAGLVEKGARKGEAFPLAADLRENGMGEALAVEESVPQSGGRWREEGISGSGAARNGGSGPEWEDRDGGLERLGAVASWDGTDWRRNENGTEGEPGALGSFRQRFWERDTTLAPQQENRVAAGKNEGGGMPAVQVVLEKVELRQEADLDRLIRQIGEEMLRAAAAGREGGF